MVCSRRSRTSRLNLLNSLSQTVQFDDDSGSQANFSSAIAGVTITQTGTYYFLVRQFSNSSTINVYTLYIDRTSVPATPEVEPNNLVTDAGVYTMSSGDIATGTIPTSTDVDIYKFVASEGDKWVIQVDGDPERDNIRFDSNFDLLNGTTGALIDTVNSDASTS